MICRDVRLSRWHNAIEAMSVTCVVAQNVVNIASVPKRSPFRYPGGKTWLVPTVRRWLRTLPRTPAVLVEPFAGGGIISLTAVFEGLAERAHLVELDPDVASVWKVVLSELSAEWLAK